MNFLDEVADWIRETLAFLPPRVGAFVWFPVLFIVVLVAVMIFMRLLPLVGRLCVALLRISVPFIAAVLLAPDMIIATVYRHVNRYPPAVLYHYGDAVATTTIEIARTSSAVDKVLSRRIQINVIVVFLVSVAVIWNWDRGHCQTTPVGTACVRPFTSWVDNMSDDYSAPLAPTGSPSHNSAPKRK